MRIYREWRDARLGGAKVSMAILNSQREEGVLNDQAKQIRDLQQEVAEQKQEIRQWMRNFAGENQDKFAAYKLLNQHLKPTIDEKSAP
tara:strand:- start:1468 stop:1731 length:264 start_codon:yes stop_codon:yes gene_type:complete